MACSSFPFLSFWGDRGNRCWKIWKTWSIHGFLRTWKTQGILCNLREIFNKQNNLSSLKCLFNTTMSWASNEQSFVNFGDGHSALVTCYIAGVDVDDTWHLKVIIRFTFCCDNLWKSIVYGSGKSPENSGNFFPLLCGHPMVWQPTVSAEAQLLRQFRELLFNIDNDGDEFNVGTVCWKKIEGLILDTEQSFSYIGCLFHFYLLAFILRA